MKIQSEDSGIIKYQLLLQEVARSTQEVATQGQNQDFLLGEPKNISREKLN